jgi:glyoxalase family protein
LTFFVWEGLPQGREGPGMAVETAFMVPERSFEYWTQRLADHGIAQQAPEQRFGETVLALRDPDRMPIALVASPGAEAIPGWSNGDVPVEHAIRGFHGVTLWVGAHEPTARVLTGAFGFAAAGREGGRLRYGSAGPLGANVDIREVPEAPAGRQGAGSVHHVAFRAANDDDQQEMAAAVSAQHLRPTDQINRCYFRSVYFREPGGVLFEIATDDPGFTVDEPKESLGSTIKLPPWYEQHRSEIVAALPSLG